MKVSNISVIIVTLKQHLTFKGSLRKHVKYKHEEHIEEVFGGFWLRQELKK